MALSEFDLIERYFSPALQRPDVALGVGDDCALLRVPAGKLLAVTVDTLVEGVHFFKDVDPQSLGHKALAVNLSDLAAMGAEPAWVTLALTLPGVDAEWLAAFSRGFATLALAHGVQLIGGDTTRGPLTISVQAQGFMDPAQAMYRSAARPGDLIYVTGTLGDAGLALQARSGRSVAPQWLSGLQAQLDCPQPRVAEALALRGLARAAIDISDGLAADLGHILDTSGVGATVWVETLPVSAAVARSIAESGDYDLVLSAGDDYELLVTVPVCYRQRIEALAADFDSGLTRIGVIDREPGLRCLLDDGRSIVLKTAGYDHFCSG